MTPAIPRPRSEAAAMSIVYFLIIMAMSWVFYTVMTNYDAER